ncbi:MAG: Z1 domain-containing protein [Actinomycetota bacterium]
MSADLVDERRRIESSLAERGIVEVDRKAIWQSVDSILSHGPLAAQGSTDETGLALGYVQSGKTTSITALIATAADAGYRVIVALLGSTNLLLDQNSARLHKALGIGERDDYRWVSLANPSGAAKTKELAGWLSRGRTVLVPLLKHAGRITSAAQVLKDAGVEDPVLIVDDEADQASLNTAVSQASVSRTYEAISELRKATPQHLYVQFTATPYAPLLLGQDDHLRPDFVEMLTPGSGYTGGREFFVDHADLVVRPIPTLDEQPSRGSPTRLPRSLVEAFASFVAGTALLIGNEPDSRPVSMLVHSTQRNAIQERYHFLLQRLVKHWSGVALESAKPSELPHEVQVERERLVGAGAAELSDPDFLDRVRYVLAETTLWLVNSASDVKKVDWRVAPVHVLVGGNKLDRGFTVEGLTVTYMNRPPSTQVDTLEQRARAFGYRSDLLPYCQFFGTPRTLRLLREIVDTEYDLRARLQDWLDSGHAVGDWAREVGLLLPAGTKPTRQAVLTSLMQFNREPGWHQLRRPSVAATDISENRRLVETLGLFDSPNVDYGRLRHRSLEVPLIDVVDFLLANWSGTPVGSSPGWHQDDIVDLLRRHPGSASPVLVTLMEHPDGGPRSRDWDRETGFVNLMQGADPSRRDGKPWYPGDRSIGGVDVDRSRVVVQVHRVRSTQVGMTPELLTLAVHAGDRHIMRKV